MYCAWGFFIFSKCSKKIIFFVSLYHALASLQNLYPIIGFFKSKFDNKRQVVITQEGFFFK